ncbi:hypothetical protein HPP92_023783 [Vanilla planifolia]|uniref:Uncharacterized protein n=1 Tax=Vanilla planifolia TaxID=51239 RepID=A0A835UCC0_VANPL|nr:hypothetical protein HPP92_023783 [Vanilla planifolia]
MSSRPNPRQEASFIPSLPFRSVGVEMRKTATAATKQEVEGEGEAVAIRRSVKALLFGGWEEKEAAVRDWAKAKQNRRRELAELGVLPPLVAMLADGRDEGCRRLAAEALVELADGSFRNKVLIVEAGFVELLPLFQKAKEPSIKQALAPLLLSISTLATTPFPVDVHPILSTLLSILNSTPPPSAATTMACAAALCHLSTKLQSAKSLVSAGAVHTLLKLCSDAGAAEAALSALCNLALSSAGREAIGGDSLVPGALVEAMAREGEPRCRELGAYLLMVVARGSAKQRRRMEEAGAVPMLLEVALLGSGVASRRAIRMLQWLKGGGRVGAGGDGFEVEEEEDGDNDGEGGMKQRSRAVRGLVTQSLHRNMESILSRGREKDANGEKKLTS